MKVSVPMITYNHEEFIAKAIDSVLMQRTNFDYEIVIGEDCSTDNTRKIIIDYQKKYPDKIRLLLNEKNMGAPRNAAQTFQACNGEYVAVLEGDDYWTSPDKMQKQADFLDNHPESVICFHNVTEIYKDGSRKPQAVFQNNLKEFFSVEELLKGNFIPHCSTMYRRGLVDIPDGFYLLKMGDWPYHILCALHGNIGYINEVMAVHIFHPAGVWYSFSQSWLNEAKAKIEVYDFLQSCMESQYIKIIDSILPDLCLEVAEKLENMGDFGSAKIYAKRCLTSHALLSVNNRLFKMLLRLYVPRIYQKIKSLKLRVNQF